MSLFGFVSEKNLVQAQEEIKKLNAKLEKANEDISQKDSLINQLNQSITNLKEQLRPEHNDITILTKQLFDLKQEYKQEESKLSSFQENVADVENKLTELRKDYIELDEEILYQSYSLFKPMYDFASSEEYKEKLEEIRSQQKEMIRNKTAATCSTKWTVDGSEAKGRKVTNDNIKMLLRCFNTDCENAIDRVKYNNIESMRARINKSYESLNKLGESNSITISHTYLQLKMDELSLSIEYAIKKQEEKEEQKRIRQEMREQAKLEKELEEARKNIDKEKKHYSNALDKLNTQLEGSLSEEQKNSLLEKKEEIENQLSNLQQALDDVDYREANQKAGYVYVISNIGAFGENVYKIGMTRRLDPMERVDELGDASVPFNFDIHAMIFSEDAPKLEAALHKAFEDRKLNMVNTRREFFRVTLDEIEAVVKANYDKTVEFIKIPPAEQYRQSLAMLEESKKDVAVV